MTEVAAVSKVKVPLLAVKVPLLFVKLPASVNAALSDAWKVSLVPMLNAPFTSNTGSLVVASTVAAPEPLIVKSLFTVIVCPVVVASLYVGLPEVGEISRL